tara:strand:- start:2525 stop:3388 length:864 start_codon:yes stop_codon:yes gene_type:complete
MGFFRKAGLGAATPGTLTSLFDPGDLAGTHASGEAQDASKKAEAEQLDALGRSIAETRRATEEGQGFLSPFGDVGLQGVEQAGFLTDPQAQFDFLQNNPLFQMGLDNANRQTLQSSASRGRLSSGDTLEQLNNNALLTASPLIQSQKNSIGDLLNFGGGIATNQANTAIGQGSQISNAFENQGNITSAGIQNRNQIQADTTANQQQLAGQIFSMVSDPRLKENKKVIGDKNGFKLWSWDWNQLAKDTFNLIGSSKGVMADEVLAKQPSAISYDKGFMKVNYSEIGVL